MSKKVRLTSHNGRASANGVYNVSHNDRTATRANEKDEHINNDLASLNVYWTCNGISDFKRAEKRFYVRRYGATIKARNERYRAQGHAERCTSINALLNSPKTCPEETILQVGDRDHMQTLSSYYGDDIKARQALCEILSNALSNYVAKVESKNVHLLTAAIHLDESNGMPHVHLRAVYDYCNDKGERVISQNKALADLGYEPPEPNKPLGRFNNRKQTYDKQTRAWWLQAVQTALKQYARDNPKHAKVATYLLNIELEPEQGRTHRLGKNEYILAQQKKEIEKNNKLIKYQDAFQEFLREAEDAEMERGKSRKREKER